MNNQAEKSLDLLNHVLRNNTTKIEGLLTEIEISCRLMREATESFKDILDKETKYEQEKGGEEQ